MDTCIHQIPDNGRDETEWKFGKGRTDQALYAINAVAKKFVARSGRVPSMFFSNVVYL